MIALNDRVRWSCPIIAFNDHVQWVGLESELVIDRFANTFASTFELQAAGSACVFQGVEWFGFVKFPIHNGVF